VTIACCCALVVHLGMQAFEQYDALVAADASNFDALVGRGSARAQLKQEQVRVYARGVMRACCPLAVDGRATSSQLEASVDDFTAAIALNGSDADVRTRRAQVLAALKKVRCEAAVRCGVPLRHRV
jgi:hypothetical protein